MKLITRDTMASFSSGRNSAIMMVIATSALTGDISLSRRGVPGFLFSGENDVRGRRICPELKKWENPASDIKQPPQDVWDWLVMAYDGMVMDAREAVEQIMATRNGQTVALPYFRTQDELDAVQLAQGIDEPVGYHNARMRMIAQMLSEREIPYAFVYPQAE